MAKRSKKPSRLAAELKEMGEALHRLGATDATPRKTAPARRRRARGFARTDDRSAPDNQIEGVSRELSEGQRRLPGSSL
jgi:hypothetical protein